MKEQRSTKVISCFTLLLIVYCMPNQNTIPLTSVSVCIVYYIGIGGLEGTKTDCLQE